MQFIIYTNLFSSISQHRVHHYRIRVSPYFCQSTFWRKRFFRRLPNSGNYCRSVSCGNQHHRSEYVGLFSCESVDHRHPPDISVRLSTLIGRGPTWPCSHWTRASECWNIFIVLLRQLSYAIKNQLGHRKPLSSIFGTQRPSNSSDLTSRWTGYKGL